MAPITVYFIKNGELMTKLSPTPTVWLKGVLLTGVMLLSVCCYAQKDHRESLIFLADDFLLNYKINNPLDSYYGDIILEDHSLFYDNSSKGIKSAANQEDEFFKRLSALSITNSLSIAGRWVLVVD